MGPVLSRLHCFVDQALRGIDHAVPEVLDDVMGMSGQAIIRDIVADERDPKALARRRDRRVKASAEEIAKALTARLQLHPGPRQAADRRPSRDESGITAFRLNADPGALLSPAAVQRALPRARMASPHRVCGQVIRPPGVVHRRG